MASSAGQTPPRDMSDYERNRWSELHEYWTRRGDRKALLPPKARATLDSAGAQVRGAAGRAAKRFGEVTPERVKALGETALDATLVPAVNGAVRLLDLTADWAAELTDPERVLEFHRTRGRAVGALKDLRALDLEDLDELTRRLALRSRTLGAGQGAATGALAMIPVAGGAAAITVDILVMHVLSTAIATRVAYAYGFDAADPRERQTVERMVRRTYKEQAPKAVALRDSSAAFHAGLGRRRWSDKLRSDHKLMAAVEKLMKQFANGQHVPVEKVTRAIPVLAIAAGAGTNAHVLGDVARKATLYAQTRFLAQKYGLALPGGLAMTGLADDEEDPV